VLISVRWATATVVVALVFTLVWMVSEVAYDLGNATALEIAAVAAAAVGLPLSWWSFRGQLLDEPAEVTWVTWRRVPAAPAQVLSRAADQAKLESAFSGKKPPRVVVISGASGTGKTELAASFARARLAERWPLVAWVNAGTNEEMLAGLLEFADALSLRVAEEGSARACERLRQHQPTGTQPSVIVFDGVVDVDAVRPFLPDADGWRVLVTSSAPNAGQLGTEIALEPFALAEASKQTQLPEEVGQALGRLPAALALASATVREHRSNQPYLTRLREAKLNVARMLGDRPGNDEHAQRYPSGAAGAILLAMTDLGFEADGLEAGDSEPLVRRVLGLLAVLSPGGMSHALLYEVDEPARVDEVLERLNRCSLAFSRMDGDSVFLHELTRRVVADRLCASSALPSIIAEAAGLLRRATFGDDQAWDRRGEGDLLVAHIAALSTSAGSVLTSLPIETTEQILGLRHWATRQLSAVGDGARAVDMADISRSTCEKLFGAQHPDTLVASDNLVIAYATAGRAADGIPLAEETLAIRERVLGADHPDTLASRYSLAYVHEYAGRLDEAEPLYDNAYIEYARVLGANHPQTATVHTALNRVRRLRPPQVKAMPLNRGSQVQVEPSDHPSAPSWG